MSVLLDLSIFPMDRGESLSSYVAAVIEMISASGHPFQLTAMGTLVETEDVAEATALIANAHHVLGNLGCRRIYLTARLDSREGPIGRLQSKTDSVESQLRRNAARRNG
jgi:uncharacterized protein (TIGR00106 family)